MSGQMSGQMLTADEEHILQSIEQRTEQANRNNITRTRAYGEFYLEYPHIHWAYLAHMVSRNGGWNMTDLQGELFPRLLQKEEIRDFFLFLERCNWLIFQDAYPQLLLYAESQKRGQPLFHLLPYLLVSVFMHSVWPRFWQTGDSKMLSFALIMNEQHYIESRVVQNPHYRKRVLEHLSFKTQSVLNFNQLCFPYVDQQTGSIRLAGTVMDDFTNLQERIRVGKHLYTILFELAGVKEGIRFWADETPHTGSRADYWPQLFTWQHSSGADHSATVEQTYTPRLAGDELHEHAPPLYSPRLLDVWPEDVDHAPAGKEDWYAHAEGVVDEFRKEEQAQPYELTDEYMFALNRMELAVMVKERLPWG